MVVTDLHGNWDDYRRYRDRFLALRAGDRAHYLVFTGDLVHSEGSPETDRSLEILLDLFMLRETLGERLIYLLGNHELPHLYGITLAKGEHVYTPRFEATLGAHRAAVLDLFNSLPFFVRTRARVSICHAGAAAELSAVGAAARVFNYSHRRVREAAEALLPLDQRPALRERFAALNRRRYDEMARYLLSASGPESPHYDDLLVGYVVQSHPDFDLLWEALINRNERQYGEADYAIFLDALLRAIGWLLPARGAGDRPHALPRRVYGGGGASIAIGQRCPRASPSEWTLSTVRRGPTGAGTERTVWRTGQCV
jgi:hypothetical protein